MTDRKGLTYDSTHQGIRWEEDKAAEGNPEKQEYLKLNINNSLLNGSVTYIL